MKEHTYTRSSVSCICDLGELADSRPNRINPLNGIHGTHWRGDLVGLEAGFYRVLRRTIYATAGNPTRIFGFPVCRLDTVMTETHRFLTPYETFAMMGGRHYAKSESQFTEELGSVLLQVTI
jgi:hypothetical protein